MVVSAAAEYAHGTGLEPPRVVVGRGGASLGLPELHGFCLRIDFVGMAGALHLMPSADATSVAGLLSLVNGLVYFFSPRSSGAGFC